MESPLKIGLAVSVTLHLTILMMLGSARMTDDVTSSRVTLMNLGELLENVRLDESGPVAVGMLTPEPVDPEAARREAQRKSFVRYVEAVNAEIHSHRLDRGESDLIGIVLIAFTVRPDGRFESFRVVESSRDPKLDDAALYAARVSSGKVKRPKILGGDPLDLFVEVRFQYGLH